MSLMKEYIERGQGAKDLEEELLKLIGEYNKIRKTYLIIYAGAIGKPIPDIYLNIDDYYIIYDLIRGVDSKQIDFYVESPGGDGAAAEELVRFLRKKFDNIDFVVSGTAKSAGTLLVLSGNNILMTESGSLGPIDAQLGIGRSIFSAYDYMDWVNSKREEAEKMGKLNPFDATMVAQISPGELKLVYHALEFAKDLVIE
jgi:ClpP class serine protease